MIAYAGMLISHASAAGMKVPEDGKLNEEPSEQMKLECPHFWVFCQLQLCRALTSWSEPGENTRVIAGIPLDRLVTMTPEDFRREGVVGI